MLLSNTSRDIFVVIHVEIKNIVLSLHGSFRGASLKLRGESCRRGVAVVPHRWESKLVAFLEYRGKYFATRS